MEGERGRRIEELYQAVRLLYREQQGDALAEFCQDDTELRREVENLLAHEGAAPTAAPLNAPAWMGNTSAQLFQPWCALTLRALAVIEFCASLLKAEWEQCTKPNRSARDGS